MSSAARLRWFRLLIRMGISALSLMLFAMHVASSPRFEIIDRIENYLYDVRLNLTMPGTIDDRIVIVDIDEASQLVLGQWPWPRDTLATIVDHLFDDYSIKVLGFDALFAEAEETTAERLIKRLSESVIADIPQVRSELERLAGSLDSNSRFAESLIARDIVTGFVFKDSVAANEPESTGVLPDPLIPAAAIEGVSIPFVEARGFTGSLPALQENAVTGGFFDAPVIDSDGVFRRAPLLQRYRGDLYASLALAVARQALGSPPISLAFADVRSDRMSGVELEALHLGERRIPVNEQVTVFIPYRGPQGSFPYVSAKDVFDGSAAREVLQDRIVLLGASAAGLLDLRSTPVGQRYIGVEAHANLISGLLDESIMQQPSWTTGLELTLLLIIALLTALLLPRLAPISALLFVVGLVALTMALNLWMWNSLGLVVPLASLLTFTLMASVLQIIYGFFIESRNKRHLSRIFGQYIPPSLVQEMDASGQDASLEGESRNMSVLFSDVRGFTTLSEKLDARELTQLMNEFLTPMTAVIHEHRGTIDKYMGDCVMAFWGAPLADEEHARHAVLAGIGMIRAVRNLEEDFARKGWPPISVGVGVSSGIMNVGNMGSQFRIAYTVMGDTVNLGSRLEGLTKQYGVDIIVSEATARLLPDFAFRELDLVRVKGKKEPVAIYEPFGLGADLPAGDRQKIDQFAQAVAAFRKKDWETARRLLEKLKQRTDELLYNVYLDRIERFRLEPPPRDWDGVFDHLSK
ncbi:MAG: adenylate/guanylate cyclase domain-containing protein [Gammaproteobacteria bacterium]|nr:adenylate/guanylate cyclase domain-containing protein [Gammaproteobacteria bacterium]MDH5213453.1 adenylate/guanylate cyclase domain-containing protein [Gammaproteobacteria bacterium]